MQSPSPFSSIEEAEFHPLSYQDEGGQLFWRNGHLYQRIPTSSAACYDDLLRCGLINELVKDGLLIESRLTYQTMKGYPRIVEHSIFPFVSLAHEWCPEMLRDAGRLILELAARLCSRSLELRNPQPRGILFHGPQPVFVNLGALHPASQCLRWPGAQQFREQFLNPLYLASAGAGDIARALMQTAFDGRIYASHVRYFNLQEKVLQRARTGAREFARRLLSSQFQDILRKRLPRHRSGGSQASHLAYLKRELESISLPQPKTGWSGYYGDYLSPLEPSHEWDPKQRQVHETLARLGPATLLDVGANRGWYSLMAAKHGASAVAIDTDSTCMSQLYADALSQSLRVLPVIMDIRAPSPASGVYGDLSLAGWERFRCDFVLALAIVHHLALRSRLTFDQIIRVLKRFSKRHLLVEFPKPEDHMSQRLMRAGDTWYTSDNFQAVLRQHFNIVAPYPSASETRELYLCQF